MPVPLNDLSGQRCRRDSEFGANVAFDGGIEMGMGPDRATQLPDSNAFRCLSETLFRATKFIEHQAELQSECDRLGMDPMTASNHRCRLELARLNRNRRSQLFQIGRK